jgi:hypothetical protein
MKNIWKCLFGKQKQQLDIPVVIASSGKSFFIKDVELVDAGVRGIKNVCSGCLFYEKDFTCKYKERKKMPIDCFDVENKHYEPKNWL